MRLFRYNRDVIIITGCNAVGKTTASNYLRNWASLHNIPQENTIIADSHCLFEAMQDDDEENLDSSATEGRVNNPRRASVMAVYQDDNGNEMRFMRRYLFHLLFV